MSRILNRFLGVRLRRRAPQAAAQQRELELPQRMPAGGMTPATPSTITALPTVYRCVTLLTHTVQQMRPTIVGGAELPRWMAHPESYGPFTLRQLIGFMVSSLALHGNAYLWAERAGEGWQLRPISPPRVTWKQTTLAKGLPEDAYPELDGAPVPLALPGLGGLIWAPYLLLPGVLGGVGPVQAAADNFGAALEVDSYGADIYGNGNPHGILATDQLLSPDTAKEMKAQWLSDQDQRIKVLGQGLEFQPMRLSPRDAAWLEAREWNAKDVARAFGIPAFMLDLPAGDSMTYQNTEDSWNAYLRLAVMPMVESIEQGLELVLPGQQLELDPEALLRPTLGARADIAVKLTQAGYSPDSVAAALRLPLQAKEGATVDAI